MKSLCVFIQIAAVSSLLAAPASLPENLVQRYSEVSQAQRDLLKGASMEVEIEARLPKLKKEGRLHALRHISRLGRITYDAIRFDGDSTVKSSVIARYLTAETQATITDNGSLAISPANYKFNYKGLVIRDGRDVHVFGLTPRKKRVGLFKGELWLDAATCLPVRESGRLVKNPSFFLRRIEFVREYDIRDGIAIPRQIDSVVETRIVGKAELTVHFSNFSLQQGSVVLADAGSE
jgi:hypothetical protein